MPADELAPIAPGQLVEVRAQKEQEDPESEQGPASRPHDNNNMNFAPYHAQVIDLQVVAVCCRLLQCVAGVRSVLQCVPTWICPCRVHVIDFQWVGSVCSVL